MEFVMKSGKSKSRAKQTDRKLSVRSKGFANVFGLDPNMPAEPPSPSSAFFCFAADFAKKLKKQLREKHPPKQLREKHPPNAKPFNLDKVMRILSAARPEWEAMSDVDKAPYVEMAEKSKEEYLKHCEVYYQRMEAYNNNKQAAIEKADKEHSEEACQNLAGLTIRQ